ncbi:MAG: SpoIID/LytB domain-containing protein [Spirochaetota bacterium]
MFRRAGYVLIFFVLSLLWGCAGGSYIRNGRPTAPGVSPRGIPEVFHGREPYIRVLVKRDISTIQIHSPGAVVEAGGRRHRLNPETTIMAGNNKIIMDGTDFETPATINARNGLYINGIKYPGRVIIHEGMLINCLPMETYLEGVLCSEIPHTWPLEALKAQAVASRTYAFSKILSNQRAIYDIENTQMHQKYRYIENTFPSIRRAILETQDLIIVYRDQPIQAFFHSSSGGRTESSRNVFQKELPYLKSIPDPYSVDNKYARWSYTATGAQLTAKLGSLLDPEYRGVGLEQIKIHQKSDSGRTRELLLFFDNNKKAVINANQFRIAVDPGRMKSTFLISIQEEKQGSESVFIFSGKGYGHGVGMSQWGARKMALSGFSYRDIIHYYYRGTRIASYRRLTALGRN